MFCNEGNNTAPATSPSSCGALCWCRKNPLNCEAAFQWTLVYGRKKGWILGKNPCLQGPVIPVSCCRFLYYIASERWSSHWNAHLWLLPQNSTWKSGREIKARVLDGRRGTAQSHKAAVQQALFFFLPLYESKLVIPPEPACNPVPEGESCSSFPTALDWIDAVAGFVFPFHPMVL